ncbi:MAG TPA: condensation domain-containing protein, partial [Thermoanaerobaculia bacterium]|nr:condensation domain-containing protein [Thermoanaerobaculia bacterium]
LRSTLLRLGPEEHVALFTMHHIVSDGWSMGVLVREVAAFYAAELEGRPAALPPLPVQYADFSRWQRDWLRGEVLETQLAYWRERLAGAPPALNLPADRPRSARTTGRGGLLPVHVPAATAAGLTALARQEGATLFMVLLAGWKALLHRYTGETDLLVGTAIANRNRAEIEGLIGFFVNTLVLRTDLAGAPDLATFLGRVRETTLGAYVHQDLPFERLVEELAPDRSLAHTPFFQVMLVLQNTPLGTLDLPGVTMEPFAARSTSAAFELNLSAMELGPGNGIGGTLEFDRDLFEPATAGRLAGHFVTLLGGIAEEPRRPVADLPLLPEAERRQILDEWNGEAGDHFPPACLHDLFAAQATRTPDALALDGPGGRATYAKLADRVRRLAGFLRGIGVGPEVPVGVCAGSSAEMVTAMLATWTAGGAYLPIDPAYPAERKAFLLEDSGALAVLFERGVEVPDVGIPAYEIGEGAPSPAERGRVGEGAVPQNTAWIVYTSGSTGRPKGVMIEHQTAADYLRTVARVWELGRGERVL